MNPPRQELIHGGLGLLVWAGLTAASFLGALPLDPAARLFLLAPWVLVPLGWRTAFGEGAPAAARLGLLIHPWAALLATASLLVPEGLTGGLLSSAWAVTAGLGAWGAARRFLGRKAPLSVETVEEVGLLNLFVGSLWLTASRLGLEPMGFKEPIVFLTAVHFHYTGFAALIFTAALGRHLREHGGAGRRLFPLTAFGVVMGMPSVGAGFMLSPSLKIAAVLWLSSSLISLGLIVLLSLPTVRGKSAKLLLGLSAASLLTGMVLAVLFGLGEFTGRIWLDILRMIHSHGMINAFGFALCGLAGWRLLESGRTDGPAAKPLVIYDGACGLCAGNLKWLHRLDWGRAFDDSPHQSDDVYQRFPGVNKSQCEQALHLAFPDGRVYRGSDAFREIALRMPLAWPAGLLMGVPPFPRLLRKLYPLIARNRFRLGGHCPIPKGDNP